MGTSGSVFESLPAREGLSSSFFVVDVDWYAFCQALYKGIEGEDWEEVHESYKEMSRAVGVKNPHEAQGGKSFVVYDSSQRQEGRVLRSSSQR